MKKRIGILTLYHQNHNYGGLLQAYALLTVLKKTGADVRQISFDRSGDKNPLVQSRWHRFSCNPIGFVCSAAANVLKKGRRELAIKKRDRCIQPYVQQRRARFAAFEKELEHTETVNGNSITKLNEQFDIFVAGSDQIWNPDQLRDAYLLTFVQSDKKKVAYAASIGRDTLSKEATHYITDAVKSFDSVSVREPEAQKLLRNYLKKPVEWVLDPTLLLSGAEWDEFLEKYRTDGEYLFAYFLGDSKKQRRITKEFAESNGIKIVGFPHITGHYRKADSGFADIELYDVSPRQFLYLIRHANYIVTDSYHACVFSILFHKKFVVFERSVAAKTQKMNSRVTSLLQLFGLEDRLVRSNNIAVLAYDYDRLENRFMEKRAQSLDFLKNAVSE